MVDKEKKKLSDKKYRQTAKYKAYQKCHSNLPKTKARRKMQRELPKAKVKRREYYMRPETQKKRKLQRQAPKIKAWQKEYRQRPEVKARDKRSYQTVEYKLKKKRYIKKHRELPSIKIKTNLSNRLRDSIKKYIKGGKVMNAKEYGVNYKRIVEHLKPFPKNLTDYHVDHIRPICSFNFINEDGKANIKEIKEAFSPKNHQWLLATDNMKKGGEWNGKRIN